MTVPHFGVSAQVYDGNKAITTQSFTELNSKLGAEFEASFYADNVLSLGSADLIFQVGDSNDVIIKDMISQFTIDLVQTTIYKNPVFSGGSPVDIYNMNDRDANTPDVTLLYGPTVTNTGTQISPTITTLGSTTIGQRIVSTLSPAAGIERVLAKGTTYLFRVNNAALTAGKITGLMTWYQGPLSPLVNLEA